MKPARTRTLAAVSLSTIAVAPRAAALAPRADALVAVAAAVLLAVAGAPAPAAATGFGEIGRELAERRQSAPSTEPEFLIDGYMRLRGEVLHNLDLDRGLTPSGHPLYPVPMADPLGQNLTYADTRLRTDFAILAPGNTLAVKLRMDLLDNLALGSMPEGSPPSVRAASPAASASQRPVEVLRLKRAWGEVLTPFGMLAAGRMGSDWGLGIMANGGDCPDCNSGDAADRVAFVTPLLNHIWAASYDFTAIGPTTIRRDADRLVDLDPSDDVRTVTFAVLQWYTDLTRERRLRAGRTALEYGAWFSYRWQDNDVPASYLPVGQPIATEAAQAMARGYSASAFDAWIRLNGPGFRVEAEAVYAVARVEQPSLMPGVLIEGPATSNMIGAAIESEMTWGGLLAFGVDAGYASGDDAPGFGAYPDPGQTSGRAGDLDGPQAMPPGDLTADNFRFHPDYHVDRILFREIIGTVTDAYYVRPHVTVQLFDLGASRIVARVAAVASWAVEPTSTPSGERPLGLEIDPTLRYESRDGFVASLEHAFLLPGAGLDNPALGLVARPAQLLRLRLQYVF